MTLLCEKYVRKMDAEGMDDMADWAAEQAEAAKAATSEEQKGGAE